MKTRVQRFFKNAGRELKNEVTIEVKKEVKGWSCSVVARYYSTSPAVKSTEKQINI